MQGANNHRNNDEKHKQFASSGMKPDNASEDKQQLLSKSGGPCSTPIVVGVEQKDYAINGRLIRPVAVTIAPSN